MSSQGSIALYEALRDAQGVSEEKARAAASSVPAADTLAIREDLATLRGDLTTAIVNLRGDLRASHAGIIRPLYVFGGLITGMLAKLVFFPWRHPARRGNRLRRVGPSDVPATIIAALVLYAA